MSPVTNPFTAPRQAGQQMAEKAKEGKDKITGGSETSGTSKEGMGAPRPRTLSNEDVDKLPPGQVFRTTLGEHGEIIQDEPSPSMARKGQKDEDDELDLYDAMTAE